LAQIIVSGVNEWFRGGARCDAPDGVQRCAIPAARIRRSLSASGSRTGGARSV